MVSDIMTMRLVKKAKVQKTRWVLEPKRALMTCRSKNILPRDLGPCSHFSWGAHSCLICCSCRADIWMLHKMQKCRSFFSLSSLFQYFKWVALESIALWSEGEWIDNILATNRLSLHGWQAIVTSLLRFWMLTWSTTGWLGDVTAGVMLELLWRPWWSSYFKWWVVEWELWLIDWTQGKVRKYRS